MDQDDRAKQERIDREEIAQRDFRTACRYAMLHVQNLAQSHHADALDVLEGAAELLKPNRQERIALWASKTFGEPADLSSVVSRAAQEMRELYNEAYRFDQLTNKDPVYRDKIAEECADVVIVLYRVCQLVGRSLMRAIAQKMAVNMKRRWSTNGDGLGQHIKD